MSKDEIRALHSAKRRALVSNMNGTADDHLRLLQEHLAEPGEIQIWDRQLYFLIKDSKALDDPHTEDSLKQPLLTLLLGEGVLKIVEYKGRQYYCAASAEWERVTGKKPEPTEVQ